MAWDQLAINRPHLAYLILGGFTSLFMLVSLFVKQRLYIGEATVATICGVVFGPNAANLLDPRSWGNADQLTLELSRIVLVVQCFAVGVELPRAYMERHWRSVVLLLVPVMVYGWLVTSLFIWWMIEPLTWLESLCIAACVTATDPVLASSVVGKGKFAKRVPRHLRDLLSAESGCNDGMAFPFIYMALYLIKYRPDSREVFYHWFCFTVLYECIFGAVYGVVVGYAARHAIKWAERHEFVDRESFLAFYFVLALFLAGSGSLLGLDDLLVGFAAGVGFSNDGWFRERTEESHVSDVIDLLLNLAYFVYFGAIIPWRDFSMPELGLTPWRLVVIAIFVILFRRIPIMVVLKPIIPDVKTWREALFAGHFGPIGVGAIFVAILARAELQTGNTTPLAELQPAGTKNYTLIVLIWPVVTFLVISSILVHGSSIAVFTLGKRINTLTITMSYTQANEDGPSWMNRLPRIQSQSKGSMSFRKADLDADVASEKEPTYPPGSLPPLGVPGNFLRRQREEDNPSRQGSRASSLRPPPANRRKRDLEIGPGGPISQSAIVPQSRIDQEARHQSAAVALGQDKAEEVTAKAQDGGVNVYSEGEDLVVEDRDGNVIDVERSGRESTLKEKGEHAMQEVKESLPHPKHRQNLMRRLSSWDWARGAKPPGPPQPQEVKRGPAHAYQFGNTIIVEDEDGEVVRKFDISHPRRANAEAEAGPASGGEPRQRLQRMGTWVGLGRRDTEQQRDRATPPDQDQRLRFVAGGRRMSKADFIQQIRALDPKARVEAVNRSDAPAEVKQAAVPYLPGAIGIESDQGSARLSSGRQSPRRSSSVHDDLDPVASAAQPMPTQSIADGLAKLGHATAAQRRREQALGATDDSDDDGTERVPPKRPQHREDEASTRGRAAVRQTETAAERRRREAALGMTSDANDSDDEEGPPRPTDAAPEPTRIRFADEPAQPRTRSERLGRR